MYSLPADFHAATRSAGNLSHISKILSGSCGIFSVGKAAGIARIPRSVTLVYTW